MIRTRTLVYIIIVLAVLLVAVSALNIRIFGNSGPDKALQSEQTVPRDFSQDTIEKKWEDIKKHRKPLTPEEKNSLTQTIGKTTPLPYRSKDVDVAYSPTLELFFVDKKTPRADNTLRGVLSARAYQMYEQNDVYRLFVVGHHNVDYTKYTYENAKNSVEVKGVYAQTQNAPGAPIPGDDSSTPEDYTDMMNSFKAVTTIIGGAPVDETVTGGAAVGGAGGGGGTTVPGNILPPGNPQGTIGGETLANCVTVNRQVYIDAERATGVPWYVLAGIHFREGNCNPTVSLRSGRAIGDVEPDVSEGCAAGAPIGEPIPVGGGCGFASLLSSAINTGNFLKGKIGGQNVDTEAKLAEALAGYNGWGNTNCTYPSGGQRAGFPYTFCPPRWPGDDHPYVYSLYDADRHATMYIRYCRDGVLCNPPNADQRPGVMTAAFIILKASQTSTQPVL